MYMPEFLCGVFVTVLVEVAVLIAYAIHLDKREKLGIRKVGYMNRCGTIAEYAIKKWMEENGFIMSEFSLYMEGNEATITDRDGDSMRMKYSQETKKVEVME